MPAYFVMDIDEEFKMQNDYQQQLQEVNSNLEEQAGKMKSDFLILKQKIISTDSLIRKIQDQQNYCQMLEKKHVEMRNLVERSRMECESHTKERRDMLIKYEPLKQKNEMLERKCLDKEMEIERLKNSIRPYEFVQEQMSEAKRTLEFDVRKLKRENKALKAKLKKLEKSEIVSSNKKAQERKQKIDFTPAEGSKKKQSKHFGPPTSTLLSLSHRRKKSNKHIDGCVSLDDLVFIIEAELSGTITDEDGGENITTENLNTTVNNNRVTAHRNRDEMKEELVLSNPDNNVSNLNSTNYLKQTCNARLSHKTLRSSISCSGSKSLIDDSTQNTRNVHGDGVNDNSNGESSNTHYESSTSQQCPPSSDLQADVDLLNQVVYRDLVLSSDNDDGDDSISESKRNGNVLVVTSVCENSSCKMSSTTATTAVGNEKDDIMVTETSVDELKSSGNPTPSDPSHTNDKCLTNNKTSGDNSHNHPDHFQEDKLSRSSTDEKFVGGHVNQKQRMDLLYVDLTMSSDEEPDEIEQDAINDNIILLSSDSAQSSTSQQIIISVNTVESNKSIKSTLISAQVDEGGRTQKKSQEKVEHGSTSAQNVVNEVTQETGNFAVSNLVKLPVETNHCRESANKSKINRRVEARNIIGIPENSNSSINSKISHLSNHNLCNLTSGCLPLLKNTPLKNKTSNPRVRKVNVKNIEKGHKLKDVSMITKVVKREVRDVQILNRRRRGSLMAGNSSRGTFRKVAVTFERFSELSFDEMLSCVGLRRPLSPLLHKKCNKHITVPGNKIYQLPRKRPCDLISSGASGPNNPRNNLQSGSSKRLKVEEHCSASSHLYSGSPILTNVHGLSAKRIQCNQTTSSTIKDTYKSLLQIMKLYSLPVSTFLDKVKRNKIDGYNFVRIMVRAFLSIDCDMTKAWLNKCSVNETSNLHPWIPPSILRLVEILRSCGSVYRYGETIQDIFINESLVLLAKYPKHQNSPSSQTLPNNLTKLKEASLSTLSCSVVAILRLKGNVERVRMLLYEVVKNAPTSKRIITVTMAICVVWPQCLKINTPPSNSSNDFPFIRQVLRHYVSVSLEGQQQVADCIKYLSGWEVVSRTAEELASSLFEQTKSFFNHKDIPQVELRRAMWEVQTSLLLVCHKEGWQWTSNLLASQMLWPFLGAWASRPESFNENFIRLVIDLLGMCLSLFPECLVPTGLNDILGNLSSLVQESSVCLEIREAALRSILRLSSNIPSSIPNVQPLIQYKNLFQEDTKELLKRFSV